MAQHTGVVGRWVQDIPTLGSADPSLWPQDGPGSSQHLPATIEESGITTLPGQSRQVTRAGLMPLAKAVFKMNSCLKQAKGVSLAVFSFIFLNYFLVGR